jgi:hypothetical protein
MPDGIGERCCPGNTGATVLLCPQQPNVGHGGTNVRLLWDLFVVLNRTDLSIERECVLATRTEAMIVKA